MKRPNFFISGEPAQPIPTSADASDETQAAAISSAAPRAALLIPRAVLTVTAAAVQLLVASTPATADWQYTTWGMTPAEVSKASAGLAVDNPDKEATSTDSSVALLQAPYAAADFQFDVRFMFSRKDNRLSEVRLELREPSQCHALSGALRSRYGESASASDTEVMRLLTWRAEDKGDMVYLLAIGFIQDGRISSCSLVYKPLLGADSGL